MAEVTAQLLVVDDHEQATDLVLLYESCSHPHWQCFSLRKPSETGYYKSPIIWWGMPGMGLIEQGLLMISLHCLANEEIIKHARSFNLNLKTGVFGDRNAWEFPDTDDVAEDQRIYKEERRYFQELKDTNKKIPKRGKLIVTDLGLSDLKFWDAKSGKKSMNLLEGMKEYGWNVEIGKTKDRFYHDG